MEETIIKLAVQYGVFAVLFVWLLFYVLKTSNEREKRLTDCLEEISKRIEKIDVIGECVQRIEKKIDIEQAKEEQKRLNGVTL